MEHIRLTTSVSRTGTENKLSSKLRRVPDDVVAARRKQSTLPVATRAYTELIYSPEWQAVESMAQAQGLPKASGLQEAVRGLSGGIVDLGFPRRPSWSNDTSKKELDALEQESFSTWIKEVYDTVVPKNRSESDAAPSTKSASPGEITDAAEEQLSFLYDELPPFEQNIEVWRQLWRVIEKSDVISLVVDIRNPLLLLPVSFLRYLLVEVRMPCVIVLTKIDLVSQRMVVLWKRYFEHHFVNQVKAQHPEAAALKVFSFSTKSVCKLDEDEKRGIGGVRSRKKYIKAPLSKIDRAHQIEQSEALLVLYMELSRTSASCSSSVSGEDANCPTIGLIGTPNAGKSSLLNCLIGKKVVSVSRSCGHTKHWQTHFVYHESAGCQKSGERTRPVRRKRRQKKQPAVIRHPPKSSEADLPIEAERKIRVQLCDSPGLVFPILFYPPRSEPRKTLSNAFIRERNTEKLVSPRHVYELFGIFPIPQIRETFSAIRFLLEKVDLCRFYNVTIDSESYGTELSPYGFLGSLADKKGYHTTKAGEPDMHRAGLEVLRDVVDGAILLAFCPPKSYLATQARNQCSRQE